MLRLVNPKITPYGNNIAGKYKISSEIADKLYPKNKDGIINMSEQDLIENPNFDITLPFEEIIYLPEFTYITYSRLGKLWETLKIEIVNDFDNEEKNTVALLDINKGYVFAGTKYHANFIKNEIYTLINKNNIMTEILDKKTYKPWGNRVELEFDLPEMFKREMLDLEIDLEESEELALLQLRNNPKTAFSSLNTPYATITAIGDKVKDLQVEDKVVIEVSPAFNLKTLTRIDLEKNKAYFIKDADVIQGVSLDNSIINK